MVEKLKRLERRKKRLLLAMILSAVVLSLFVCFTAQRGIQYEDHFLLRQEEGLWSGKAYGEKLTIRRTEAQDGTTLLLESGERRRKLRIQFGEQIPIPGYDGMLEGTSVVILENGQEVFRGAGTHYQLWDEKGELFWDSGRYYTVNGVPYVIENGIYTQQAVNPADVLPLDDAVRLAEDPDEVMRGLPWMAFYVLILLVVLFIDLWNPMILFSWNVGRFARGDETEPSDRYLTNRTISNVLIVLMSAVLLIVGMTVHG